MENDISRRISASHSDASPPNRLSLHRQTCSLFRIFSNRRAKCPLRMLWSSSACQIGMKEYEALWIDKLSTQNMSFKLRCWHSLSDRTAKQGLHFSIKYPCFFFQRNLWRNVSFEGRHRQKATLSVGSQLKAREDRLEAEPSPNRDQISTVIYTAREIHIPVEKKIILTAWETSLFLLCHQSLFICSSASQVLLLAVFS